MKFEYSLCSFNLHGCFKILLPNKKKIGTNCELVCRFKLRSELMDYRGYGEFRNIRLCPHVKSSLVSPAEFIYPFKVVLLTIYLVYWVTCRPRKTILPQRTFEHQTIGYEL